MLSKRNLAVLLMLLLSMLFVACGGDTEETAVEESPAAVEEAPAEDAPAEEAPAEEAPAEEVAPAVEGDCGDEGVFCVGLVTDVGEIDDKSFNQSAWEGVLRAQEELGAQVDYIETGDAKDYASNISLFAENGYNVIVTVGFAMGEATAVAASEYPDITFIGVDQFQGWAFDDDTSNDIPNLSGLIFHEEQSGFLAGALAAMMTETGKVGAVLGTDLVPPVVNFKEGYEAGALYINPDIELISTFHPGGMDVAFTDPEWGATTARQALDQGVDVIFGAGGKTGNGALIEVAAEEGALCIGVDSDQWETVPEAHNCLISSAMKLIMPGVFDLVSAARNGSFEAGNFFGGSGLADFHDFADMVPQEVKDELEAIDVGLKDGSIIPGETVRMDAPDMPEESVVAVMDGECGEEGVFCVGLVTDVGEIDDKSFNQSAWEGALRAQEELGAQVDYIETGDAKDYASNIALFAEGDYNVIVTVGFAMGEATAAAAVEYPEINFIGVDQFQGWAFDDDTSNDIPNLIGLIFHEDQSGFLAGALAAMMTESGKIGAVLGTDLVPPVVAFKEGYEAGALYINPDIELISTFHPGGMDVAFTDPEWGATTARQALDQGVDVIFGAGGKTGNGALIEVAAEEGALCIGVDSDQWETVPEAHNCLISSAMKLITPGVFNLVNDSLQGSFAAGNYFGGSGLAPFHDFDDAIPQDVKDKLEAIDAGLKDGSIETGY